MVLQNIITSSNILLGVAGFFTEEGSQPVLALLEILSKYQVKLDTHFQQVMFGLWWFLSMFNCSTQIISWN